MSGMETTTITCMMCGEIYSPQQNNTCTTQACTSCPINQGCSLVRCPRCGFEGIDPSRSTLARLFSRWGSFSRRKGSFRWRNRGPGKKIDADKSQKQLAELPPGSRTFVYGFQPRLSLENKARLQAYGLTPGQEILVLQQSPVTIVLIEHLELALENEMARSVIVSG